MNAYIAARQCITQYDSTYDISMKGIDFNCLEAWMFENNSLGRVVKPKWVLSLRTESPNSVYSCRLIGIDSIVDITLS